MPKIVNPLSRKSSVASIKEEFGPNPQFVGALAKGLSVLEAFAEHPGPMSLGELALRSNLDKSTVQRLVFTLLKLGYLRKGSSGRGFYLGLKLLDRSFDFLISWTLIERATPVINDLCQATKERADLSLFDDLSVCYAIRRQSKRQTFFSTLVGLRVPTFCSSGGRAILSKLSDAEVDDIIARSDLTPMTPKTIIDPQALRERVARAREDGYALVYDESLIGEIAVGSAVVDHQGRPVAAIHVAGSLADWTPEEYARRFSPLVVEAAHALSGAVTPF